MGTGIEEEAAIANEVTAQTDVTSTSDCVQNANLLVIGVPSTFFILMIPQVHFNNIM